MSPGILIPIALIRGLVVTGLPAFFVFMATMGVLFAALRFLFSHLMKGKHREVQGLLNRMEQIVAASPEEAAAQPLPEATARLDASLLAEEAEPEDAPTPTKARSRTSS